MNIVFYIDIPQEEYFAMGRVAIAAVRKHMPLATVVLQTDDKMQTDGMGAEVIMRFRFPHCDYYAYRGLMARTHICGETIFLGLNCVLQRDLTDVFDHPFDVALCYRRKSFHEKMPFNGGVAFSRCPGFWKEVMGAPEDHRNWIDTETRVSRIAMSGKYRVRMLDGGVYNHVPDSVNEDFSHAAVVHYKGEKRKWMVGNHGHLVELRKEAA